MLYIIRPNRSTRGSGLYPYRYTAYICGATFSILMASLAFINPKGGYVTQGTFCYLPPRPFWYRLALAWIPRYLILGVILVIYIAVFIYVRTRLNKFESDSTMSYEIPSGGSSPTSLADRTSHTGSRVHRPSMVPLRSLNLATSKANGFVDLSNNHKRTILSDPEAANNHSQASDGPSDRPQPVWERYSFGRLTPLPNVLPEEELQPSWPIDNQYPRRNPTIIEALQQGKASYTKPSRCTAGIVAPNPQTQPKALGHVDSSNFDASSTSHINILDTVNMRDAANASLRRRHMDIKRQIRCLFVYPLVYMVTWIIPFINHCFQYNDYFAAHPSFPLVCTSTTIIALQCAIDCWLFGYREKPWRQMTGGGITFWNSFLFWKHWDSVGGTLPAVERQNAAQIEPKNWWSQEDMFRDISIRRESNDPVVEAGDGSMAAGLRRNVGTYTNGGKARMASDGINLTLVSRYSGASVRQLVVQEKNPAQSESEG